MEKILYIQIGEEEGNYLINEAEKNFHYEKDQIWSLPQAIIFKKLILNRIGIENTNNKISRRKYRWVFKTLL